MCPVRVDSHSKVPDDPTDQIFTVLSLLPLAMNLPSALKQTEKTLCWREVSMCKMEDCSARTQR